MSGISIYRALFLPVYCSSSSFIPTVNQSNFDQVFSTLCTYYFLFLKWCSTVKTPHLVSSSPSITLWISPELYFTSLTWPFGMEIKTVSNFHRLLSPLWFLNWKYSWVPPSVCRNPLFYELDTILLQQTLILEGTYKNPCSRRSLLKNNLFFKI